MLITGLQVAGVGKFANPTKLTGFGPGLNILAANNEAGKSTLFRALRACLREASTTRKQEIRDLASAGRDLPLSIDLEFEQGDIAWRVVKTFLRGPRAVLFKNGERFREGEAVDEELLRILAPDKGAPSTPPWGILWVEQGQSFELQKEVSQEMGGTLADAVTTEMGDLLGGDRARTVLNGIITARKELVTDKGKPRTGSPLDTAMTRLTNYIAEHESAVSSFQALEGIAGELESKQRELARLTDPHEMAKLASDLATALQELRSAEHALRLLEGLRKDEELCRTKTDQAQKALEEAQKLRAAIEADRVRAHELQASVTSTAATLGVLRHQRTSLEADLAALAEEGLRDKGQQQDLKKMAEAVRLLSSRATLGQALGRLEDLENRRSANALAMSRNVATAERMAQLDELERNLNAVMARLEASAPEVSIVPGVGEAGEISVGGVVISSPAILTPFDPLTIHIGQGATISVVPRAADIVADRARRTNLQEKLETLLQDCAVASSAGFRQQHALRQGLEATRTALVQEFRAWPGRHATSAEAIAALRIEIAGIEAQMRDLPGAAKRQILPDREELERLSSALEVRQDQREAKRQIYEDRRTILNEELAKCEKASGELSGALTEIQNRLAVNLGLLPDDERQHRFEQLEADLTGARDHHVASLQQLQTVQASAPAPERLEQIRTRVTRLEGATENQKKSVASLERVIFSLETQLALAGEEGRGETVAALEDKMELARRDVDRQKETLGVLSLLKETIEACFSEQRTRVQAPLMHHLVPLLGDLFPDAVLEFDDGMAISSLRRSGPGPENFSHLSHGTREQIAVLVRLAMGALISVGGPSVPIILDDALAFSDDARIEQMFDALGRAARNQQVIILTCRAQAFARLGGHMLAIGPGDPA